MPAGEPVTAASFMSLFRDMSTNTPFFIFAALEHDGLVVPSQDEEALLRPCGHGGLPGRDAGADRREAAGDAKPKKNAGKKAAPVKTPSVSTKKQEASELAHFRWSSRRAPRKPMSRKGFFCVPRGSAVRYRPNTDPLFFPDSSTKELTCSP